MPTGAAAFSVLASAVPALRDKPAPVAFPRPATTLRSETPVPVGPASTPVPATGPLAPTLRKGTPGAPPPGGGVAAAVAVTVPAAAAAPAAPPVIAGIQVVGKRSDTPAGWPDGTPTAQTTIPPRAMSVPIRRRSSGPLVAVVLAVALFGGSLFAAFRFGVFGSRNRETTPAPAAAPAVRAEPPVAPPPAPVTVVKDPAPPPAESRPEPEPAATLEPETPPAAPPSEPPRAKARKRAKKTASDRALPPPPSSEDNVIDPFK